MTSAYLPGSDRPRGADFGTDFEVDLDPEPLRVRWAPGTPGRLVVAGEIDLATSAEFEAALRRACAGPEKIILDLSEVTLISSVGIGALYRCQTGLAAVLVSDPSRIARALMYAGFGQLVPVLTAA